MSKYIGRKTNVGIGRETTRGTAVAPTFWIPLLEASFDDKFEAIVNEQGLGVIEDADDVKVAKKWAEGDLTGKVLDKSFGLILLAALGSVSSAVKSGETTVYEHTFSVQEDAQHDSLTVEIKNPNEQLAYANAVVNGLEISAELGKFVEFVASIMAKTGASASNTPSYSSENDFIAKNVTVKFADDLSGLDAASAVSVKNVSLKIDKNVEPDDVLGSNEPSDFLNKQFAISGSIEMVFDATTYKSLALAGTQKAIRIEITNSDTTIGTSSNPKLQIDLAKVKLTEWEKSSGLNDIVTQTLTFKALYSLSDSKMVTIVLTNEQSSYTS